MKKIIIIMFVFNSLFLFGELKEIYLAGGCFWCVESDLEKVKGVKEVISGYSGGHVKNPKYKEVSSGVTGHREAVKVIYDTEEINYSTLLYYFLKKINPTDGEGQFVDRGFQYSPAIFYTTPQEKGLSEKVLQRIMKEGNFKELNTSVEEFKNFYPAEEYHQDYYKKNSLKYKFYRYRSGRDEFLEKTWGK